MASTSLQQTTVREAAADATRSRILAVACEAFFRHWYDDVTLRAVARDAGVALQTVVNHFGSKEALYTAANVRLAESIDSARWVVRPGDVERAVEVLVKDYERTGDHTIRNLAVEEKVPEVKPWIDLGRARHQEWVEHVFAEALQGLPAADRKRRVAQLVVATDVYTWKLLRRDKGLSRRETVRAVSELVRGVMALERRELE